MTDRTIFPNLRLFKKEVTERFLLATQEIYKHHPIYLYNDDELTSKILIRPSYTDVEASGQQPKLVVQTGAYRYALTDSFFNNMAREYADNNGLIAGFEYDQILSTSVTVIIQAYAEEESSDLADEFAGLAIFACRTMYNQVGLLLRGAQVSETNQSDHVQNVYQTVVSFDVEVPWTNVMSTTGPIDGAEADIDSPITPDTKAYKTPGIDIDITSKENQVLNPI